MLFFVLQYLCQMQKIGNLLSYNLVFFVQMMIIKMEYNLECKD